MQRKKAGIILKTVIELLVPLIFTYLGQSGFLNALQEHQYIGKNADISYIKEAFIYLAAVYTAIYLGIRLALARIRLSNAETQRKALLNHYKRIFLTTLSKHVKGLPRKIDIRIFVPESRGQRFKALLVEKQALKTKKFAIKNISGLADEGTTGGLSIEVAPNAQGLVGKCYNTKMVQWDFDLKNSEIDYNFNEYQSYKIDNLGSCICVPILTNTNNVKAIMSLDSLEKLKISEKDTQVLVDLINEFCQLLSESVPDLF